MTPKHVPGRGLTQLHGVRSAIAGLAAVAALIALPATVAAQSGGTAPPGGAAPAPAPAPTPTGGTYSTLQKATWYGPGLWGNRTACGMPLLPTTLGVAHKRLPCGTQVTFTYGTRIVPATVIDRGPFRRGYAWDLTKRLAKRLGFLPVGSGPIRASITVTP